MKSLLGVGKVSVSEMVLHLPVLRRSSTGKHVA